MPLVVHALALNSAAQLAIGLSGAQVLQHMLTITLMEQGVSLFWEVCWRGAYFTKLAGGPRAVWQGLMAGSL